MHTKTEFLRTQLANTPMLTDAGLETDMIFNHAIELPYFASFDLLSTDWGKAALEKYYRRYLDLARRFSTGFILETPTWRASSDWGGKMGYSNADLSAINQQAIALMQTLRAEYHDISPVLISGNIGPRGDGYVVTNAMTATEAENYHRHQVDTFAATGADMVSVFTLNYVEEAIGITSAAKQADIPIVLSFTVETDGCLPSGASLRDTITAVESATDAYPLHYMINCAHPSHFKDKLIEGGDWLRRIKGIRGNASKCSHAELNEATALDDGNPVELGRDYRQLRAYLPALQVYGGCCGTDHRHVEQIAAACLT